MNLVHFISVLSISSLIILSASAQTRKTKSTDVEALRVLEASFGIISLSSDPCLPEPYSWIKCSSDDTPRITTIDLHDENIYGVTLPDFSSMDALEIIDLSGNIFSQEFPDFLAKFPKLKVLNLAGNFFYGTIPTSLENNKNVIVTLTGTQQGFLCYSDKELRNRNRDRNFTRNIDS
ncbi:senescence-induced receptor-like serine/threonine-protein kinase isoform X1 [Papaver somniferum]|uniref:senescence-induced receptor-like serine/threonine-protein kinase isoform X1 n=1 Tax=Papaver somniferum TaxID=3469 RepID=UPI000E6F53A9|nr:senescence-induced receptor-like serine/threonine-protein kinase isoform X1 [Papaver somniferum]